MKKAVPLVIAAAVSSVLTGCGTPKPKTVDSPAENSVTPDKSIEINIGKRPRILFQSPIDSAPYGDYAVEYIHTHYGEKKDETLDYKLTLNADSTYTLDVVSNGVSANHHGNWYIHRGGDLIMYYDEEIEPQPHNVYVSDCLYAEMLHGGKIMIHDSNAVVVLSKVNEEPSPDTNIPQIGSFIELYGSTTR